MDKLELVAAKPVVEVSLTCYLVNPEEVEWVSIHPEEEVVQIMSQEAERMENL